MDKINFNLVHLFEESSTDVERYVELSPNVFDGLEPSFHITFDDTYYEVTTLQEDRYIYFVFDFGKANPRDDNITNVQTGEKKENPRKDVEAELLSQLFCLYYFDTNTLYISNYKKLSLFLNVLQDKLGRKFQAKSFFKDKDEFISILKSVNKISFTEARELFNQNSTERKALVDLTGTDAPDRFTIEAEYSKPFEIVPFLKKLLKSKDDNSLKDLVICGKDESNFSVLYNHDTFLKRLTIKCNKEDNGKFNPTLVLKALLKEVLK